MATADLPRVRCFRGGQPLEKWTWPTPTAVVEHRGLRIAFCFEGEDDVLGEGPLAKIEFLPSSEPSSEQLAPRRVREAAKHMDTYWAYARAAMRARGIEDPDERAAGRDDIAEAADILRLLGAPGRGHDHGFYVRVAANYRAIVDGGEPHPVKALAAEHQVTISTASRWISEARRRGLLPPKED